MQRIARLHDPISECANDSRVLLHEEPDAFGRIDDARDQANRFGVDLNRLAIQEDATDAGHLVDEI